MKGRAGGGGEPLPRGTATKRQRIEILLRGGSIEYWLYYLVETVGGDSERYIRCSAGTSTLNSTSRTKNVFTLVVLGNRRAPVLVHRISIGFQCSGCISNGGLAGHNRTVN